MSSDINMRLMGLVAEVVSRAADGTLSAERIEEMLKEPEEVLPSIGEVQISDGVPLTEDFLAQTMARYGQKLVRHRKGGGFVPLYQDENDPDMPYVSPDAWVGVSAMVVESGRVLDNSSVLGYSRVEGHGQLANHSIVYGNSVVTDHAKLSGHAMVYNDHVGGNTELSGHDSSKSGKLSISLT